MPLPFIAYEWLTLGFRVNYKRSRDRTQQQTNEKTGRCPFARHRKGVLTYTA